mmetsp:Transcript_46149/g.133745  ORF Transcript_46149/g.133745 Transcript_46149/m.133745 type:complete len:417 (-) Transcript_46149:60-1310(-)
MPRGHRRTRRQQPHMLAAGNQRPDSDENATPGEPGERTVIFSKTKMCKFHILGMCSKGSGCRFAHHKDELNPLPDLSCTKLCKTLISTGSCEDPNCSYAHNREELRALPDGVSLFGDVPEGRLFRNAMLKAAAGSGNSSRRQEVASVAPPSLSHLLEASPEEMAVPEAPAAWQPQMYQAAQPFNAGPWAQPPTACRKVAVEMSHNAMEMPHPNLAEVTMEACPAPPPGPYFEPPRLIVKNTFLDIETGGMSAARGWSRCNTWATSLCGLAEDDQPSAPPQRQAAEPAAGVVSGMHHMYVAAEKALESWPEDGRFFSREVSATSDASTEVPTEKRLQDTPGPRAHCGSADTTVSNGTCRSAASTPPNEEHAVGPPPVLGSCGVVVKNTFLQFTDELEEQLAPLRAVRTAAGRLDLMG